VVYKDSWKVPGIMRELQRLGAIPEADMWDSFNMGIGMIAVVRREAVKTALKTLKGSVMIGEVVKGRNEVVIK
jgi:phosphoribosylformylglycinamidine cyclo-ligase